MFQRIDADADGEIDAIDWLNSIPLEDVPALVKKCRTRGKLFRSALSPGEMDAMERMLERLDAIAARAAHLGVRLMVSANVPGTWQCVAGTFQAVGWVLWRMDGGRLGRGEWMSWSECLRGLTPLRLKRYTWVYASWSVLALEYCLWLLVCGGGSWDEG
jgi:hypothetical protein